MPTVRRGAAGPRLPKPKRVRRSRRRERRGEGEQRMLCCSSWLLGLLFLFPARATDEKERGADPQLCKLSGEEQAGGESKETTFL